MVRFEVSFREIVPGHDEFTICEVNADEPLQHDLIASVRMYGDTVCEKILEKGKTCFSLESKYRGFYTEKGITEPVSVCISHDHDVIYREEGQLNIRSIYDIRCNDIGEHVRRWVNPNDTHSPITYNRGYGRENRRYGRVFKQIREVFEAIRDMHISESKPQHYDGGFRRLRFHPKVIIDGSGDGLELSCLASAMFMKIGL